MSTYPKTFCIPNESLEIVVIEDNKLINMLISKTFDSTINRIRNLKNFPIKFSSFKNGADFYSYLENNEFGSSRFIVFSDNYFEKGIKGTEILNIINQKEMDVTVIALSDSAGKEDSVNTILKKAHGFIPGTKKSQFIPAQMSKSIAI